MATLAPASPAAAPDFAAGLLRLADPKVTLASMAAILLSSCAAAASGPLPWGWLAVVVVGVFAVEAAKNASGEVFDFDSGTDERVSDADRTPFSGGKRVLVDRLLTRRQTWGIAAAGYALALAAGLLVVLVQRDARVLALGLLGLLLAWTYHAPPLRLSYRGLGELAVGLCYGPLLVAGTHLVLRRELPWAPVLAALPLGLLIAAFLWINELPDAKADAASGKRTLVVRLGRPRAARAFAVLLAAAFLLLAALVAAGRLPVPALLGLLAAAPATRAARLAIDHAEESRRLVPAQAATLLSFLVYAAATGVGLLLAGA